MPQRITLALLLIAAPMAWPQPQAGLASPPAFEVASVKPDEGRYMSMSGGPGTNDPNRISYSGITLAKLIVSAYGISGEQLSGPEWLYSERYSVNATIPPGTSLHDFDMMMQALLRDRFSLSIRREFRDFPVYGLVVAKGGPKLKSAAPDSATSDVTAASPFEAPQSDRDGCPFRAPGDQGFSLDRSHGCGTFRKVSTALLAHYLENFVGVEVLGPPTAKVRVEDMTNLKGDFDFTLHFVYNPKVPRSSPDLGDEFKGPSIFDALGEIGLRLEKEMVPLDFLIVDHAERVPREN